MFFNVTESESGTGSASVSGSASVDVDPNLPYPGIAPIALRYLSQTTRPRNWCLALISNPYPFYNTKYYTTQDTYTWGSGILLLLFLLNRQTVLRLGVFLQQVTCMLFIFCLSGAIGNISASFMRT